MLSLLGAVPTHSCVNINKHMLTYYNMSLKMYIVYMHLHGNSAKCITFTDITAAHWLSPKSEYT